MRPRALALALGTALAPAAAMAQGEAAPEPIPPSLAEPSFLLSLGWVAESAGRDAARVLGTTREGEIEDRSLTTFDPVFLPLVVDGRRLAAGDRVQLYRLDRELTDPETEAPLGTLALPTGVAVVDGPEGDVVRATIEEAFLPVLVGDRARVVTEADTVWGGVPDLPTVGTAGVVVAFQTEKEILPPYDAFVVRRTDGPPPDVGDRLELYRPGPREGELRLPDVWLGSAVVARVQGDLAIAVLLSTERSDLRPGDRAREVVGG